MARGRPAKVARNEAMAAMRDEGVRHADIARAFGVSRSRVEQILGVSGGQRGPDRTVSVTIEELARAGWSDTGIAVALGVEGSFVARTITKYAPETRERRAAERLARAERMVARRRAGVTYAVIGAAEGVSAGVARREVKRIAPDL
jgi:hypothetical protein